MSRYADDNSSQYSYYTNATDFSQDDRARSVGSRSTCSRSTRVSRASRTTATSNSYAPKKPNQLKGQTPSWLDSIWGWYEGNGEVAGSVEKSPQDDYFDDDYSVETEDAITVASVQSYDVDQSNKIGTKKSSFVVFRKHKERKESPYPHHDCDDLSQATLESDSLSKYSPMRRMESDRTDYERRKSRGHSPLSTEEREDQSCGEHNHDGTGREMNQHCRQKSNSREIGGLPPRHPRTPRTKENQQRSLPPSQNVNDVTLFSTISDDEPCHNEPHVDPHRLQTKPPVQDEIQAFETMDQSIDTKSNNKRDETVFTNVILGNPRTSGLRSLGARKRFASPIFRRAASFDGVLTHDASNQDCRTSGSTDSATALNGE